LRFSGKYYQAEELGLNLNYYRDLDPQTGRYIESDPIGLQGGINPYAYVGGNPTSDVDPSGLEALPVLSPLPLYVPAAPPGSPLNNAIYNFLEMEAQGAENLLDWTNYLLFNKPPRINNPEADREHDEYKARYLEPEPPNLDRCQRLLWKLNKEKRLLQDRQAWDAKWQPAHAAANAQSLRAIKNLEDELKKWGCKCQ
jgi:RHS repeat-associated protein